MHHDSSTDLSLIESLSRGDSAPESWSIFLAKYAPLIYRWSVRWGAASHDAEEVLQDTLLKIHQKLNTYQKQPDSNFRSWLKTVAYYCWLKIMKDKLLTGHAGLDAPQFTENDLMLIEARQDLVQQLQLLADQEILELACRNVRSKVEEQSWNCFVLNYFDNLPGTEIALRLGMSTNAVYLTSSRLRRMLREEINRIDPE